MSSVLSPILHPASGLWMLGRIDDNIARPLSRAEIEAMIDECAEWRLRELSLRAEVESLTADKARLDWLEERAPVAIWRSVAGSAHMLVSVADMTEDGQQALDDLAVAGSLRASIDEARKDAT